ncbi:RsmB/NOP family class I SAM-dependent RNA methyltransferase [Kordia sp.]|uniref:RsmB/NOP family class I SAM-dependent RNA methyltransferase n=1 Tax=Kordia sp. TaxID=1965332 RepID=UPI003D6AB162
MRLHRNLVFSVIDGLNLIFNEGAYADKVVEKLLKRDARWGSRDRKFVAETTYEIVRWKRLYAEVADIKENYSRENLWRIFAVWATLRGIELPDWNQLAGTPTRRIKGRFDELSKIRKIKESIPDWLDELGVEELGEDVWTKEINALNKQADVILRTNTLRTTKEKLQALLATFDNETEGIKGHPVALRLKERANIFRNEAFKNGFFEVQDANSQLVSEFLDVKPGMKVVDACAGAGGKSLHLAALMENKGNLISLDIYEGKLRELKRRARRNGAHNIETRVITSTKVIKKLYDKADRVLIDAPCSGLGVLRRNPDAKWKIQPEFLEKVKNTQQDILQRYSRMVKSGGKLVYATCSILPSENQEQVEKFLASNEDFTLVEDKKLLASESGFDGFYMALLERK